VAEGQEALLANRPTLKILNDELTQILAAFETVELEAAAPEVCSCVCDDGPVACR
jgi:hypothetical protein